MLAQTRRRVCAGEKKEGGGHARIGSTCMCRPKRGGAGEFAKQLCSGGTASVGNTMLAKEAIAAKNRGRPEAIAGGHCRPDFRGGCADEITKQLWNKG